MLSSVYDTTIPKKLNVSQRGGNKFRHQGFAERIENIDFDIHRRIEGIHVDLDDGPYKERLIGLHASLFDERIKYWKVHDCSRHFSNFYEEITQKDIASSLPIIIMHKEEVCGVILKHLQIKGSMSVLSLVDLLSVLSKDLRNEFYPNLFYQAMQVLVDLLDPRYPELLEAIFVCISYLFKFLMKYLVKDIQDIFRVFFANLFTNKKVYIRKFASDALSYLIRKVDPEELPKIFDSFQKSLFALNDNDNGQILEEGLAQITLSTIKGIQNEFHSCANYVLRSFFKTLYYVSTEDSEFQFRASAAKHLVEKICDYSTFETSQTVCVTLFDVLQDNLDNVCDIRKENMCYHLIYLDLINMWICYRKSSRLQKVVSIQRLIFSWIEKSTLASCKEVQAVAVSCLLNLWKFRAQIFLENNEYSIEFNRILKEMLSNSYSLSDLKNLTITSMNLKGFDKILLSSILSCADSKFTEDPAVAIEIFSRCVTKSQQRKPMSFHYEVAFQNIGRVNLVRFILQLLQESADQSLYSKHELDLLLMCSKLIIPLGICSKLEGLKILQNFCAKLFDYVSSNSCGISHILVLGSYYTSLAEIDATLLGSSIYLLICSALEQGSLSADDELGLLQALLVYSKCDSKMLHFDSSLFPLICSKLSSTYYELRIAAISILSNFPELQFAEQSRSSNLNSIFSGKCNLLNMMSQIFSCDPSISNEKQIINLFHQIRLMISSQCLPLPYIRILPHFLLGALFIRYQPFWKEIIQISTEFTKLYAKEFASPLKMMLHRIYTETTCLVLSDVENEDEISSLSKSTEKITYFTSLLQIIELSSKEFRNLFEEDILNQFQLFFSQEFFPFFESENKSSSFTANEDMQDDDENSLLSSTDMETKEDELTNALDDLLSDEEDADIDPEELADSREFVAGSKRRLLEKMKGFLSLIHLYAPKSGQTATSSIRFFEECTRYLLSTMESPIQVLVLKCIHSWKLFSGVSSLHFKEFEKLINSSKEKDVLTTFTIRDISSTEERIASLELAIRIIFPKILNPVGKGSKSKLRTPYLVFLSSNLTNKDELMLFINMLFEFAGFKKDNGENGLKTKVANASIGKKMLFLHLFQDILKQFRISVTSNYESFFALLCMFARESAPQSVQVKRSRKIRILFQRSLRYLGLLIEMPTVFESEFVNAELRTLMESIELSVKSIPRENTGILGGNWKFLSSWSRSTFFVSKYAEFPYVMESLISSISAPSSSFHVQNEVFCIFKNILMSIENCSAFDTERLVKYLNSTSPDLLHHLVQKKALESRLNLNYSELEILKSLVKYVEINEHSTSIIFQLFDILLPFIQSRKIDCQKKLNIVNLMRAFSEKLIVQRDFEVECIFDPNNWIQISSKIFLNLSDDLMIQGIAECIANTLERFACCSKFQILTASNGGGFIAASEIIRKLNMQLDCSSNCSDAMFDCITFLRKDSITFGCIEDSRFQYINLQFQFILLSLLRHVNNRELGIRRASTEALCNILENSPLKTRTQEIISSLILPFIVQIMKDPSESKRRESIALLEILSKRFLKKFDLRRLTEISVLFADIDGYSNFLIDISHIQTHNRRKAISWLLKGLENGRVFISEWLIWNIILPLLLHMVLPPLLSESENLQMLPQEIKMQRQRKEYDRMHDLIEENVRLIGRLSSSLTWSKYLQLIETFLKNLSRSEHEVENIWKRVSIRAACAILDNFTFDAQTQADSKEKSSNAVVQDIRSKLMPPLVKYLDLDRRQESNSSEKLATGILKTRIIVATAIVRFLKKMPKQFCDSQIPWLVTGLSRLCGDENAEIRDQARQTLTSVALTLGSEYFGFIVEELKHALKVDYKLHILGYIVNALLNAAVDEFELGSIDYCLKEVLDVLFEHLLGSSAETRAKQEKDKHDTSKIKRMKEMSSEKALSGFKSIGRLLFFERSIGLLVNRFERIISQCSTSYSLKKVNESIYRFCLGLKQNSQANAFDFIAFSCALVSKEIEIRCSVKANSDALQSQASMQISRNESLKVTLLGSKNKTDLSVDAVFHEKWQGLNTNNFKTEIMICFGLQIIFNVLKFRANEVSQLFESSADHVKSVVELIYNCSHCDEINSSKILTLAFKILSNVVRIPQLSSGGYCMKALAPKLANVIMKNANSTSSDELSKASFEAITSLIRNVSDFKVRNDHLAILLKFVEQDMIDASKQAVAFPLLKAILSRKLICPEIYDIMQRVLEMMIQTSNGSVTKQCNNALLQFLMDYPMKSKLRQQYFNFLLNNVKYEQLAGRLAVLELMRVIMAKFPQSVLDENAELVFVPLVQRLAVENDESARNAIILVVSQLIENISAEKFERLYGFCVIWSDPSSALKSTAIRIASCTALCTFLELMNKKGNVKHTIADDSLFKVLLAIETNVSNSKIDLENSISALAYTDVNCDGESSSESAFALDEVKCKLLQIHLVLFEALLRSGFASKNSEHMCSVFEIISDLGLYPHHSVQIVITRILTVWLQKYSAKALTFVDKIFDILIYHYQEEGVEILTSEARMSGWIACMIELVRLSKNEAILQKCADLARKTKHRSKKMLVLKLFELLFSEMLLTTENISMDTFKSIASFFKHISAWAESMNKTAEIEELLARAEQLSKSLEIVLGQDLFITLCDNIRSEYNQKRMERKEQQALEAVLDPEKYAKRKIALGQKKRLLQKRKIDQMRYIRKGHVHQVAEELARKKFKANRSNQKQNSQ